MELEGRGAAYRGTSLSCPGCGETMRSELVPSAEVDVCGACGGIWVDWFDGAIDTLAVEAESARVERGTPPPGVLGSIPESGSRKCPRCQRALMPDMHRFVDARDDELVTGVELLRCTECAGSFVPRSSAHLLFDRTREARAPSLVAAVIALVRSALAK